MYRNVYIHVYIHIYIHTYIYTDIHTYIYTYIYILISITRTIGSSVVVFGVDTHLLQIQGIIEKYNQKFAMKGF